MKLVTFFVTAFCSFLCKTVISQVTLQTGTPKFSIPIYSYSSQTSKLNFSVNLDYTAGNGIKVDDQASEIGLGWSLNAGGQVIRLKAGDPDDQIQKDVNSELHFRAGLFYKPSLPPTNTDVFKLAWAPSYEKDSRHTYYDNNVHYDREHDQFVFNVNGRSGKFILGTDVLRTPLLIDKSGIKIQTVEYAPVNEIVGSIGGFVITDENGIEYKFLNPVLSELLEVLKSCYVKEFTRIIPIPPFTETYYDVVCDEPNATPRNNIVFNSAYVTKDQQFEIFVPRKTGYYISHAWYLSEIKNPQTNEKILFNYLVKEFEQNKGFISSKSSSHYDIGSGQWQSTLNITENYESIKYPELTSITLPNNFTLLFSYNRSRLDMPSKNAISEITYKESSTNTIVWRYELTHQYFYKSEIVDEVNIPAGTKANDVSLCLKSVQKYGVDGSISKPLSFEYYTGIPGDNHVIFRERFNYSKDYWGYNNIEGYFAESITSRGTQINMPPLDEYLESPDIYRRPESNVTVLQIGMLKKIVNEYGGTIAYEYEPNKTIFNGQEILSGGLRVKQVVKQDNISNNSITKSYKYIKESGQSSSYGYEKPTYNEENTGVWIIPNSAPLFKNYNKWAPVLKSYAISAIAKNIIDNIGGQGTYNNISDIAFYYNVYQGLLTNPKQTLINVAVSTAIKIASYYYPPIGVAYRMYTILKATGLFTSLAYHAYDIQMYSKNVDFINSANPIVPYYSRVVEEVEGTSGAISIPNNGKTIYEFYSNSEIPFLVPVYNFPYANKQRKIDWAYGLPKKVTVMNAQGNKVSEKEFTYDITQETVTDNIFKSLAVGSQKLLISPDDPNNGEVFTNYSGYVTPNFVYEEYSPIIGNALLRLTKDRVYNSTGGYIETISEQNYNVERAIPNYTKTQDSKGNIIETKTYYPFDYTIPGVLSTMLQKNISATPVSIETWQTKGAGQPEMLSTIVTEFDVISNGDIKPTKTHGLETTQPISQNTIGTFNSNQLIRNTNLIKSISEYIYDTHGNIINTKAIQGNRSDATIYGYGNILPVASVNNTGTNDFAYTSFEKNDFSGNSLQWNWFNSPDIINDKGAPTGVRYTTGSVYTDIISYKNKPYILSFWAKGNNFTISPQVLITQKIAGPNINGWKYYEYEVTPTSSYYTISVNGNGFGIDELRLYPKGSAMTTTTYNIDFGKTSECDINNRIVYYEYDGLGRISKVLDEHHNIIKTYEYHFKN